jgi:hypothetical protein
VKESHENTTLFSVRRLYVNTDAGNVFMVQIVTYKFVLFIV